MTKIKMTIKKTLFSTESTLEIEGKDAEEVEQLKDRIEWNFKIK